MTTSEESDDPFLRHFQRDPLPDAGIRIIHLTDLPVDRAEAVIAPIADHLAAMGRVVETRIVGTRELGSAARWPSAWPTPISPSCWSRRPRSRGPRAT